MLTILILIFGEITPKSLATRYSERISLAIAPVMYGFMRAIYPLVWLFNRFTNWVQRMTGKEGDPMVTEAELISMVEHGEEEGTIEADEREMIERVFILNDLQRRRRHDPDAPGVLSGWAAHGSRQCCRGAAGALFAHPALRRESQTRSSRYCFLRDLLEAVARRQYRIPRHEYRAHTAFRA